MATLRGRVSTEKLPELPDAALELLFALIVTAGARPVAGYSLGVAAVQTLSGTQKCEFPTPVDVGK